MSKKNVKQKKIAQKNSLEYYLTVLLFVIIIPLTYSDKTQDPTIPRLLYWSISLLVLTVITLFAYKNKEVDLGFLKLWIFPVYLLYFLISIVSLTQAINPAEGFFDLTKTFLSLFSLIMITFIFTRQTDFKSFLAKSIVVSSFIATALGLYQYIEFTNGDTGREFFAALYQVRGLMAHKNQFAISLFLMLPFSIYGAFEFKRRWKYASIASVTILIISFVFIQTRSVWVGFLVFIVSFGVTWLFTTNRKSFNNLKLKPKKVVASLLIVVAIAAVSALLIFQKSNAVEVLKYQANSLFDFGSKNNKGRLQMWESTYHMSTDHALLGVGAGNWKISIIPYYSDNFENQYQNWRRPHNDFLWAFSEKGIFGLLSYLLLFILVAFYGIKTLSSRADIENIFYTRLMLAGLGGYFVIAFFTFPYERVNHQIYLALIMGGIISNYYKNVVVSKAKPTSLSIIKLLIPFVLLGFSVFYAAKFFTSEIYINKYTNEKKSKKPNWNKLLAYSNKAFSPFTTLDSRQIPIHMYIGVIDLQLGKKQAAINDFKMAYTYHPNLPAVMNNLGYAYSQVGDYKKAISLFKEALELFPGDDDGIINLANAYYLDKNYVEARKTLLRCDPESDNPKIPSLMNAIEKKINTN